jgi:Arc/MetJ-type ribon-helix-helix transcriptional regulator
LKTHVNWNIPVPKALDVALEVAVKEQVYSTKCELVREAVRRRLKELGYSI